MGKSKTNKNQCPRITSWPLCTILNPCKVSQIANVMHPANLSANPSTYHMQCNPNPFPTLCSLSPSTNKWHFPIPDESASPRDCTHSYQPFPQHKSRGVNDATSTKQSVGFNGTTRNHWNLIRLKLWKMRVTKERIIELKHTNKWQSIANHHSLCCMCKYCNPCHLVASVRRGVDAATWSWRMPQRVGSWRNNLLWRWKYNDGRSPAALTLGGRCHNTRSTMMAGHNLPWHWEDKDTTLGGRSWPATTCTTVGGQGWHAATYHDAGRTRLWCQD